MTDATVGSAAAPQREERRVVTALFADLVGSTALSEQLDAEDVKLVVGDAVARIVGEIEALGGYVKDLAGDGVLAFFGAPVTHEDDAERAVLVALRVAQDISEYAQDVERGWGISGFGVRVGLATGPVVLGSVGAGARVEYAAFGDTVNTAARLQSAAEPGVVLVDESTRRLVEGLFAWGDARELELKGKSGRVRAFTVDAAVAGARRVAHEAPLVGRDRELDDGRALVERLRSGSGGIFFVAGDPGVGKTRLLSELRHLHEDGGGVWLEGRCVSYGESLPYWPFRDLLRGEWLGAGVDEPELRVRVTLRRSLEQLFGDRSNQLAPYLAALLGLSLERDAAERIGELSPEALQYRTFEVVSHVFERLAADGPLVVALEDFHWADATSLQLTEQLLPLAESAAVLLVVSQRLERDHPSWRLRELAAREFPHLVRQLELAPLGSDSGQELLRALVQPAELPSELERRILDTAEGNPFFLEELVRSLGDTGALVREDNGWRFEHEATVEVPQTVEKVILARIDRLPADAHRVVTAASALGRRFALPLLDGVLGEDGTEGALHELQRLGLVQQSRRWPQPEYRFKHALIQETAYRTLLDDARTSLHRRAAEWLEQRYAEHDSEALGVLAYHWLAAANEEKAIEYLARAGDRARQEYALDEAIEHYRALLPLLERRNERQAIALVLFKLALALHTSLRFREANDAYQRAFDHWSPPTPHASPTARLRVATSFLPNDNDPKSAIAWPNIQLCMQLFDRLVEAWPERTIVPSLAERWEISDDGLRYVFHLREGLTWSDGEPLTAHDVEFGIKRVLDPRSPGSSVAIYFVLENGQDYYLGRNDDADRIGVRALDDRTVEFRLVAPAPYFMSVMNRPDGGPQPRHAIERDGAQWTAHERQVVSGAFAIEERSDDRLMLRRREMYDGARVGNVDEVEFGRAGDADLTLVRYTPRLADLVPHALDTDALLGPAAWSAYLRFDHAHPIASNADLRRALAHAIDREALAAVIPSNLVVATGGIVPPALQGHTPDIALRFDPDLARDYLARSGFTGELELAGMTEWDAILETVARSWEAAFGGAVTVRTWSWDGREAITGSARIDGAALRITGWLPGYADPEYYLRLLFQSDSRTNEGGFSSAEFDELIERARRERDSRARLERFHEADRLAVAGEVAAIPLVYGRSTAFVTPHVKGWWEFGKTSANFADLTVARDG